MFVSNASPRRRTAKFLQRVEPMVLEQTAIDWLVENGKAKTKKISFTDYMNS